MERSTSVTNYISKLSKTLHVWPWSIVTRSTILTDVWIFHTFVDIFHTGVSFVTTETVTLVTIIQGVTFTLVTTRFRGTVVHFRTINSWNIQIIKDVFIFAIYMWEIHTIDFNILGSAYWNNKLIVTVFCQTWIHISQLKLQFRSLSEFITQNNIT